MNHPRPENWLEWAVCKFKEMKEWRAKANATDSDDKRIYGILGALHKVHRDLDNINTWMKDVNEFMAMNEEPDEPQHTPGGMITVLRQPFLRGWIGMKPLPATDADGMQIFRDTVSCPPEDATETAIARMTGEAKELHIQSLLKAMVYGVGSEHRMADGCPVRSMSGFLEQTGRLPSRHDEVSIRALTWFTFSRGLEWVGDPQDPVERYVVRYLTECKLVVCPPIINDFEGMPEP